MGDSPPPFRVRAPTHGNDDTCQCIITAAQCSALFTAYASQARVSRRRNDPELRNIQKRVKYLFSLDACIECIDNSDGSLCSTYPPTLFIPTKQISEVTGEVGGKRDDCEQCYAGGGEREESSGSGSGVATSGDGADLGADEMFQLDIGDFHENERPRSSSPLQTFLIEDYDYDAQTSAESIVLPDFGGRQASNGNAILFNPLSRSADSTLSASSNGGRHKDLHSNLLHHHHHHHHHHYHGQKRKSRVGEGRTQDHRVPLSVVAGSDIPSNQPSPAELSIRMNDNGREEEDGEGVILSSLFSAARFSRVRSRFVVPVIRVNGKYICRSSTLSHKAELLAQTVNSRLPSPGDITRLLSLSTERCSSKSQTSSHNKAQNEAGDSFVDTYRQADVQLLKHLGIRYIADLMVEERKVKYGFAVCGSEKVDQMQRYKKFVLASLPYPGVECFRDLNVIQNSNNMKALQISWEEIDSEAFTNGQRFGKALVGVFENGRVGLNASSPPLPVRLDTYREWDLISLTQNYLKLLLFFIADDRDQSGLLVHCISGWDRTPMFTSLLRISLWADGEIHQSLSSLQVLYLTVAYDWLMFCHEFADRTSRGEDIFYFCFTILDCMVDDEYSMGAMRRARSSPPLLQASPRTPRRSTESSPASSCVSSARAIDNHGHGRRRSGGSSASTSSPASPSLTVGSWEMMEGPSSESFLAYGGKIPSTTPPSPSSSAQYAPIGGSQFSTAPSPPSNAPILMSSSHRRNLSDTSDFVGSFEDSIRMFPQESSMPSTPTTQRAQRISALKEDFIQA